MALSVFEGQSTGLCYLSTVSRFDSATVTASALARACRARSYTLAYSRADAPQEKSRLIPLRISVCHDDGSRYASSACFTVASSASPVYSENLNPVPLPERASQG